MDITKQQLLDRKFLSVGVINGLEYLAKENEFGDILYIPIQGDKALGIIQSISKDVLNVLSVFAE